MTTTLLLHGFCTDLETPLRQVKPADAGFQVFCSHVESGEYCVFRWGEKRRLSVFDAVNPFSYLSLYRVERQKARDVELLHSLQETLQKTKPTQIICHSMGCYLLIQYLQRFQLPESVKKITFLQADCSLGDLESLSAKKTLMHVKFQHIYSFFDYTLWTSSLLHRTIRAGLRPVQFLSAKNTFFPSFSSINLHTACLIDKRMLEVVNQM